MTPSDHLLYPVFKALRERGISLGVAEYRAAVESVRAGLHLESPDRLCRLLCLLWAKRRDDIAIVTDEFRKKTAPRLSFLQADSHTKTDEGKPENNLDEKAAQVLVLEQKAWKGYGKGETGGIRQLSAPQDPLMDRPRFRMTPRPALNFRDAARAFRRYSRPLQFGPSDQIDVDATIAIICREKYLVRPAFKSLKINRAELMLLLDRGGSMTPFSLGIQPMLKAVQDESGLRCPHIYYFHDCPGVYLYKSSGLAEPVRLEEAFAVPATGLGALIVSDAGAARGDMDGDRADRTRNFLDRLKRLTPRVAWLNPVPEIRWEASTAGRIARLLPMFPLTREGLEDAVKVLRGHSIRGARINGH